MPLLLLGALIVLAITLVPGLSTKIETTIQDIFGGISKGTIGPVFTYYVIGTIVVTVVGVGAWVAMDSIAKKRGEKIAAPSLGQIGPGPAPQFNASQALDLGIAKTSAGLGRSRSKAAVVEQPKARRRRRA